MTTDRRVRALDKYPNHVGRTPPSPMFYGPFDYPGRRPDGPWHEDETLVLLRAWRSGDSLDELSERHHRPIEAILSRLRDRGAIEAQRALTPSVSPFGFAPHCMPLLSHG